MSYTPPFPVLPELMTLALLEHARGRGLHDVSVRSLARAMRTAPGSLTYHYGGKDEMLADCARFLGWWLSRDIGDRLLERGLPGLAPHPDHDEYSEEFEYAVRLRLWCQLTSYGLSSPTVALEIRAANERLMDVLAPFLDPEIIGAAQTVLAALEVIGGTCSDVREDR